MIPEVGQLIRIKEIGGTKLASKRKPVWAVLDFVSSPTSLPDEEIWCRAVLLQDAGQCKAGSRLGLIVRHFDIPTEKQIPDWVHVALAKRALLGEDV